MCRNSPPPEVRPHIPHFTHRLIVCASVVLCCPLLIHHTYETSFCEVRMSGTLAEMCSALPPSSYRNVAHIFGSVRLFLFHKRRVRLAPYPLLKASEKLQHSEPGSELACVLIWQVTDGCGQGIVPGGGILLGTVSRHPLHTYTHTHLSTNPERIVHPFVSVDVCQSQVWDILSLGCLVLH